jgi:hypothetical protein
MGLTQYKSLIGDGVEKTRQGWIERVQTTIVNPEAVQLPGRPGARTLDLMTIFMDNVVGGVVENYKSFSKKQREELGIDGLAKSKSVEEEDDEEGRELSEDEKETVKRVIGEKPRTLMEFYNIVLYLVALENIENINVAKVSLLSEKLGSYLSEPQELLDDINSGLELNEPGVSFYMFFMSLFSSLTEKEIGDFTAERKKNLVEIINSLIVNYYSNRDVKRELQRMVQYNEDVMRVIGKVIKDNEPGKVIKANTLFQLMIDEDNREKYIKFLKSLLPSDKLKELESLPAGKGGKKTRKLMPKRRHRSYHRRL